MEILDTSRPYEGLVIQFRIRNVAAIMDWLDIYASTLAASPHT
jgi:hypothetical protein